LKPNLNHPLRCALGENTKRGEKDLPRFENTKHDEKTEPIFSADSF